MQGVGDIEKSIERQCLGNIRSFEVSDVSGSQPDLFRKFFLSETAELFKPIWRYFSV